MPDSPVDARKAEIWDRFQTLLRKGLPADIDIPDSPAKALEMGFKLGLRTGYSKGLVDGVDVGVDVGVDLVALSAPDPERLV